MSSNKCRNCGLVNPVSDRACRRCGYELPRRAARHKGSSETKGSSLLYTLLAVALLGGAAYYLFKGFEKSYQQISATEANRLAAQPNVSPAPFTSRTESDNKRAEPFKNAIANNPNIAAVEKRNEEHKRLMNAASQPSR